MLPVSTEINCRACHASGSAGKAQPSNGWVNLSDAERDFRLNVLRLHDDRHLGTPAFATALANGNLDPAGLYATVVVNNKAILCASCHLSEALPGSGQPGIPPLTSVIHTRHSIVADPANGLLLDSEDNRTSCYYCHPGKDTKCLRGVMGRSVAANGQLAIQCQSCHGKMSLVGSATRTGWLDEPTCQACHTGDAIANAGQIRYDTVFALGSVMRTTSNQRFATVPNSPSNGHSLYRFSRGHGGLYCQACHNSTHAEFPSIDDNDNIICKQQQGYIGPMAECQSCHGSTPNTVNGGPHGLHPMGQSWVNSHHDNAGTSCRICHGTDYRGTVLSRSRTDRTLNGKGTKVFWRGFQIGCYSCHNGPNSDDTNPNSPAMVKNLTASTTVGKSATIPLQASDANNNALTLRVVSQPLHGTAGLSGAVITYFPDSGYAGNDTITYAAWDGSTDSNLGTISITVAGGGTACAYTITPANATLGAGASSGTVAVGTTAGCAWTAASDVPWLTVTSGTSGTGPGMVAYNATANTGTVVRSGSLTIAGLKFIVNQGTSGIVCSYAITPTNTSVNASAHTGTLAVGTTPGCSWMAIPNVQWITVTSGAAGTGSGTVTYSIDANTGIAARSGTLTITGQTFTVNQTANMLPVARPAGPYIGTAGLAVTFNGSASADSDGTIAAYSWNFGDSSTGIGVAPTHSYAATGVYTVTLTVTDNRGGTNTATTTPTISAFAVALKNGVAVTGISGDKNSLKTYKITVPSDQTLLEIKTTGGTGDCDLDLVDPHGVTVKRLINATNNENAQVSAPANGDWVIHLYGQTAYANVTLLAKYSKTTVVSATPLGLTATDGTFDDRILVTWRASVGATSYEVYRNTANATVGTDFIRLGEVSVTMFEDSTAEFNKLYYYFVKAKNSIGSSKFSAGNSGYLAKIPSVPISVTASNGTYFDRIRVAWVKSATATSYMVFRTESSSIVPSPATDTPIGETNALFLNDFGGDIIPQVGGVVKNYFYWVAAKNQNGISSISKPVSGFLSRKGPATVTASNGTYSGKIMLTWGAVPGATSYDVYRYTDKKLLAADATFMKIAGTSYDDTSATKGKPYYYRVKAKYGSGNPPVYRYDSDFSPSGMGLAAGLNNPEDTVLSNGVKSDIVKAMNKGSSSYFSIDVPMGTTSMVATLDGTPSPVGNANDCDLFAKFASYPTVMSYNARGVENKVNEILTVSNPSAGTWYFLLYGTMEYSDVTLTVDCHAVKGIVITQVPMNDLEVPFTAAFKGKVCDETGTGIPNIVVQARNPITGLSGSLTKTDVKGIFSYSVLVNSEGEHTFDFFFTDMPDNEKSTASHTVATKIGYFDSFFDTSSYLPATPIPLTVKADTAGLQNFLETRKGWNDNPINKDFETKWAEYTIVKAGEDTQLAGKMNDGLYMLLYGVEGAGAGNDTTSMSAFSAVPLVLHVETSKMAEVLANLKLLGLLDDTKKTDITSGKTGIIAVASISDPEEGATPSNISL
ncbi:MAG: PKD domain-containing protein, partial [Victivallales bacterium]